ncbi:MAG: hypothetical protein WDO69_27775 [Pseudomonadota bacterium]
MSRSRRLSSRSCAVRWCRLSAALVLLNAAACSSGSNAKSTAQAGADNGGTASADAGAGNPAAGNSEGNQGGAAGLGASGVGAGGVGGRVSGGGVSGGCGGMSSGGASALGPTVNDFIGLDAFIDDPMDKILAIGNVREYHPWQWNEGDGDKATPAYPNEPIALSPTSNGIPYDDYYKSFHDAGLINLRCIQGSVPWLDFNNPAVATGAHVTLPASWVGHSKFFFQLAARYGSTVVPGAQLKVASSNVAKSGLGLVTYYEDGNELDENWTTGGDNLLSPAGMAAMTSADRDGDQGRLGAGFGLKSADPGAKLVMAGLAGSGKSADLITNVTTYLDGMRTWATAHRNGDFPADVINVHDYCFGPDAFGDADPRPALSPEQCGLGAQLKRLAQYRDQFLPGKEVWLTEFGYDTADHSRLRAPAIGSASAEVVQGQWLVRSFLALLESGIDRAFLYVSRDDCTGDVGKCPNRNVQFSSAGILSEKGSESPKVAWYFLATFRARLARFAYAGTASKASDPVSVARFYDPTTNQGAYVVWSPTSNGSTVAGFHLPVASAATPTDVITLETASVTGHAAQPVSAAGGVTLDVSETPLIVLVDGRP